MNKAKVSVSILTIAYLSVSFIATFGVIIYEVINNRGYFNIWPVINYLGSLIPFVLILLYCFAFCKNHIGKTILIALLSYKAASFLGSAARIFGSFTQYLKNGAVGQFIRVYFDDLIIDLGGIAVFTLLILYLLRVIKCKTALTVISFSYFIFTFFLREISMFQSFSSILRPSVDAYTIYFIVSTFVNLIGFGLSLAIWLIFTKSAILKD